MAKPPGFLALVSPRSNYMSVPEKKFIYTDTFTSLVNHPSNKLL